MTDTSRELAIYAVNNGDLYRRRTQPIINNLARKIAKGVYQDDLALKLWFWLANDAAQRYAREFGSAGDKWFRMFTVADRREAAAELADYYADELHEKGRELVS